MQGELIRVIEKQSKYGKEYFDCLFKMKNTGSFIRSCIYSGCRNFANWKNILQIGNVFSGLQIIEKYGKLFIDADSIPILIRQGDPGINQELRPGKKQDNFSQGALFL